MYRIVSDEIKCYRATDVGDMMLKPDMFVFQANKL